MKKDRFVTPTWSGHFDISEKTIKLYYDWVKFEKNLDPKGASESTTRNGWQYIFSKWDAEPDWLNSIKHEVAEIKKEIGFARIKTEWIVDYDIGGYQDPHFHTVGVANVMTTIVNLAGEGEVVVLDPRQLAMGQGIKFADEIKLAPGDWFSMPSYLIHSSRPCNVPRSILVFDCFVDL
jgi:hypothetical protein